MTDVTLSNIYTHVRQIAEDTDQPVERGQRLMLRKSEATALLTARGYRVAPKDWSSRG